MRSILIVGTVLVLGCSHAGVERVPASHHSGAEEVAAAAPQSYPSQIAWMEVGPRGLPIARVIVPQKMVQRGGVCPTLTANSLKYPMTVRSGASGDGRFSDIVCEASLPSGATAISIGGLPLPSASVAPQRILVLGDTGCLVKDRSSGRAQVQNCNDPSKGWPFAELVAAAAALHPDLVIHVGDYHYREAACPDGNPKCAGSPYGDTWDSWNADFFGPAQSLLSSAPWVFVRGNHEACNRAQEGFFRYLDPRPMPQACVPTTPPYTISFQNLTLVVMDSSAANPTAASVASLAQLSLNGAWLVTHRPLWLSPEEAAKGDDDGDNDDEESASTTGAAPKAVGVPSNVSLVLTGHRHLLRALTFTDRRAPQITAGNGGTKLEGHPSADAPGTPVDAGTTTLASVNTRVNFGFVLLQRAAGSSWFMGVFDKTGKSVGSCDLSAGPAGQTGLEMNCNITQVQGHQGH